MFYHHHHDLLIFQQGFCGHHHFDDHKKAYPWTQNRTTVGSTTLAINSCQILAEPWKRGCLSIIPLRRAEEVLTA